MTVHLIKLCVGVDDVRHLARLQGERLGDALRKGQSPVLKHVTRNIPKNTNQILDGGSIYWVIKGFIRVRQPIIGIEPVDRSDGRPACALVLNPNLVRTEIKSFRPFQGWRYLAVEVAPADAPPSTRSDADVPAEMAAELKALGLL